MGTSPGGAKKDATTGKAEPIVPPLTEKLKSR